MKRYCLHFGQQVRNIQGLAASNAYWHPSPGVSSTDIIFCASTRHCTILSIIFIVKNEAPAEYAVISDANKMHVAHKVGQ
jgi:hypothetical protein